MSNLDVTNAYHRSTLWPLWVKREKSAPLGIVQSILDATSTTSNPKTCHVIELVQLGFYFCRRSCKYTKCTDHQQTVQFRSLLDFFFFVGERLLPADTLIEYFMNATPIIVTMDNQKNTIRGEYVSHLQFDLEAACPVRAGVNIFLGIREHGCLGGTHVSN